MERTNRPSVLEIIQINLGELRKPGLTPKEIYKIWCRIFRLEGQVGGIGEGDFGSPKLTSANPERESK